MVLLFTVIGFFIFSKSLSKYNDSKAVQDVLTQLIEEETKKKPLSTDVPLFDKTEFNKKLAIANMFTILLYDMQHTGVIANTYKHRYRILREVNGKVTAKDTKWYPVTSACFARNKSNMGMELAARDSTGKVWTVVTPPGYTNYLGNSRYGAFNTPATTTTVMSTDKTRLDFWLFYPQYTYIRKLLQIPVGKISKYDYNTANRYHRSSIIYYGGSFGGRRRYGTFSNQYTSFNGNKAWRRGGGGYGK